MRESRQRKRSPRVLIWVAFLIGGLTLAGCGSDAAGVASAPSSGSGETSSSGISSEDADRLADAQAQLEELQDSVTLGAGSGLITIEGVDYSFEAKICYSEDTGFEASGPGQTADGVAYWASLSSVAATRAEMEETGLPQANIDAFFGDRDSIEGFTLEVELGKESQFSSGDDSLADYRIDVFDMASSDDVTFTLDGTTLTGTGSVTDNNGVALEYNETVPVTFTASCS